MKKILIIIISIILSVQLCYATEQVILGSTDNNLPNVTTEYMGLFGPFGVGTAWHATEANVQQLVAADGTFSELIVNTGGSPGSGNVYVFTVRHNGAASSPALTCTIIGAVDNECSDLVNSFTVSAGDRLTLEVNPASTPTVRDAQWSVKFTSDNSNESILMAGQSDGLTDTRRLPMMGITQDDSNGEEVSFVVPVTLTLKDLYVELDVAPGAGNSWTLAVSASSFACTVSDTDTTCNQLVETLASSVSDARQYKITSAGTPAAARAWSSAIATMPNDGEFLLPCGSQTQVSGTATWYSYLSAAQDSHSATETQRDIISGAMDIIDLHVRHEGGAPAPGAGKSYIYTLRDDAADANTACTISDAQTNCTNSDDSTIASLSFLSTSSAPSGSPNGKIPMITYVGFISPGAPAARRRMWIM